MKSNWFVVVVSGLAYLVVGGLAGPLFERAHTLSEILMVGMVCLIGTLTVLLLLCYGLFPPSRSRNIPRERKETR